MLFLKLNKYTKDIQVIRSKIQAIHKIQDLTAFKLSYKLFYNTSNMFIPLIFNRPLKP